MKFALAVVVVLAVAMGVQSSIIGGIPGLGLSINGLGLGVPGLGLGWGAHGLGLGYGYGGPLLAPGLLGVPGAVKVAAPYVVPQLPAAVNIASGPIGGIAVAKQAAVASPLVAPGATYVAKTRGAIHTAPLAGHVHSAASINVAPAPGTW